MKINNFIEAKEVVNSIVLKHNGVRQQITINGDSNFFRDHNYINNFQILCELKETIAALNEINTLFCKYEKQLEEISIKQ